MKKEQRYTSTICVAGAGQALRIIFLDLREAAFSTFSFWGRARMHVIFLVWHVPVRTAFGPNIVGWSK